MTDPRQPSAPRHDDASATDAMQTLQDPIAERWPLEARVSLVMTLCGLFWGVLGAAVLQTASR